jgi:hypothetical protein
MGPSQTVHLVAAACNSFLNRLPRDVHASRPGTRPDNLTLIIAESYSKKLTSFEIAAEGSLMNRRVWADLGDGVPDGICRVLPDSNIANPA